ncbi:HDIG domain-containing metalloprotein [Fundidesulfovibrio soli]|uniref:HDIG domain-containing metalloprotein n=1 Tax=Fundidesulfovibrio soli TaxID=2922716 RepID=UPI001FAF1D88|nr:HDIG domain-containing metalloprotein [Fundidesulfovibrio soli]
MRYNILKLAPRRQVPANPMCTTLSRKSRRYMVMHPEITPEDVELLRAQGMNEEDLDHSLTVAELALDIAERTGAALDMRLVARGALFHDLGKTVTHAIEHGKLGAELGAKLGLPPEVCAVMEKHIRGGLSEAEALEFGLPVKDYALHRLEERVIIYADRLVDIITEGKVPLSGPRDAEDRFEEILAAYPKYGKNAVTMARYFGYHREIQGLIAAAENISSPA